MKLVIREWDRSEPRSEGLIFRSWMNSYARHRSGAFRLVSRRRIFEGHRPVVDLIVKRARVLVAKLANVDAIVGFAVYEPGILHYVYVRKHFRRAGIASALIQRAQADDGPLEVVSHATFHWSKLSRSLFERRICYVGYRSDDSRPFERVELPFSPGAAFYGPSGDAGRSDLPLPRSYHARWDDDRDRSPQQ